MLVGRRVILEIVSGTDEKAAVIYVKAEDKSGKPKDSVTRERLLVDLLAPTGLQHRYAIVIVYYYRNNVLPLGAPVLSDT